MLDMSVVIFHVSFDVPESFHSLIRALNDILEQSPLEHVR